MNSMFLKLCNCLKPHVHNETNPLLPVILTAYESVQVSSGLE